MTKRRKMPPADLLRELLTYDPLSGVIFKMNGGRADTVGSQGYRCVMILGDRWPAHRIAWLLHHGRPPVDQIDHINGDRSDNRLANLRECDNRLNSANRRATNPHGFKGVKPGRHGKRWQAKIKNHQRDIHLGTFDTPEEAHEAYLAKAKELFGEFARGNA